jgi:hypothetical protein
MSKKLIAIASAAALALSALIAAPAVAVPGDITVENAAGDVVTGGASVKTALSVNVPDDNDFGTVGDADYLEIIVDPSTSGQLVTASSNGAIEILTADEFADAEDTATTATGKKAFSEKAVTTSPVNFYVYTTSTTAGVLTVRNGDNVRVINIKGIAGEAHTVTAKFPSSLNSTTASKIDATVKDVFGNALTATNGLAFGDAGTTGTATRTLTVDALGAATTVDPATAFTYSTSRKSWVGQVIGTEGGGAASITVTLNAALIDYETAGLADPKLVAFSTANSADLATQIATLTAKLANSVSKAKYNNLVKKYNKITRGKKASLVK